jgi:hypothetical protein
MEADMPLGEFLNVEDHGEWLNFRVPIAGGSIPVKMSREALEDHFRAGADSVDLVQAYVTNADVIHAKVLAKADGKTFTPQNPLELRTTDF